MGDSQNGSGSQDIFGVDIKMNAKFKAINFGNTGCLGVLEPVNIGLRMALNAMGEL